MKILVCGNTEGLTEEKIKETRDIIASQIRETIKDDELVIIFDVLPNNRGPLNALGRTLEKMADADAVYFSDGYTKCRSGIISYTAARLYNKKIIRE